MTSTTVHSVRRHDDDTLFVRLSPEFAWELFQAADRTVDGDWKLPNQPDSVYTASGIEFLPLKLTCGDEVTYASYNGGDADDTLTLPRSLLQSDGPVTVQALGAIPTASSISVEPLTYDDWMVLETQADAAAAQFLAQVSVVYDGQILRLIIGRDVVRVQAVVSTYSYCRLVADTRVVVVPPPSRDTRLRVVPAKGDLPPGLGDHGIDAPEGTGVVHPETMNEPYAILNATHTIALIESEDVEPGVIGTFAPHRCIIQVYDEQLPC